MRREEDTELTSQWHPVMSNQYANEVTLIGPDRVEGGCRGCRLLFPVSLTQTHARTHTNTFSASHLHPNIFGSRFQRTSEVTGPSDARAWMAQVLIQRNLILNPLNYLNLV